MSNKCDSEYWTPDPKEVEHLALFGTEAHAIVAIGDTDSVLPWQIGRAAGFSGGTTSDEAKRRANWASAASKATKLNKKILPHIAALRERLVQFRTDGGGPKSISWKDKLDRCEWLIQYGTPSESLRAVELHNKMQGLNDSTPNATDYVATFVAKVGAERTRRGFEELGAGHLIYAAPDLFTVDEYEARLTKLEEDNGKSGPAARCAGDDPRNLDGGGSRGIGDDAAGKMDRGPKITGGAGAGERSDGSRDIDGRLSELENLEMEKKLAGAQV